MAQLSIRFLGASTDRLIRTVEISNGLKSPASKKSVRVPPLVFPQGRMKTGMSPKVSKDKVGNLKHAGVSECVFTDTFETGDSRRKYCQVFYDHMSRYGYVTAMRSKTDIGDAFADFCCQCWVPLILIRDNAGENVDGSLVQELRDRNVQSAFICPYRSQQNFAEGYIGRVTVMASFGMVFSGAPLFMWVHAMKAAAFISNITATFYAVPGVWATPYELVHGERFPDASVVVPFGCAALILLDKDEQAKFQSRCVLMLFMHYADRHSLFTYAFYSPKTKRIVFRQDCIFLTTVFPMRHARVQAGLLPDGEPLVVYRSPGIMRDGPPAVSFQDWTEADPLPSFDDVSGFELFSPGCFLEKTSEPRSSAGQPGNCPDHPGFAPSFVHVPAPAALGENGFSDARGPQPGPVIPDPVPRRSSRVHAAGRKPAAKPAASGRNQRQPVGQRWSYEPVSDPVVSTVSLSMLALTMGCPTDTDGAIGEAVAALSAGEPSSAVGASIPPILLVGQSEEQGSLPQGFPHGYVSVRSFGPIHFNGIQGAGFTIKLVHLGEERAPEIYAVFPEMPVSLLRHNLAWLLQVDEPVSLFVGPTWLALDHSGTITDLFLPGTTLPCPYLVQGSEVRVQVVGSSTDIQLDIEGGESSLEGTEALSGASCEDHLPDLRRVYTQAAIDVMNLTSNAGSPSPYELVYGLSVSPAIGVAQVDPSVSPRTQDTAVEDTSGWGALNTTPITWGRPDPPPHPEEGIDWSNSSDRYARAKWDLTKGSVSPPPRALVADLFSDRGDGFSLMHLRRNGEDATTKTIRPKYVSSRSFGKLRPSNKNEEQTDSSTRSGEQTPPSIGSGEQNSSSSIENGENTSGKEGRMPRERRLRESRKTPFRLSPTPRGFHAEDDDLDAILEAQRLEDLGSESRFPEASSKRKREVISDADYRLRKERTDDLINGLRQVRERSLSPPRRSPSSERLGPEPKEKGEHLDREEGEQLPKSEQLPKPVPEDLDPPPPLLDDKEDDTDSENGFAVEPMREVGTSRRTAEGTRKAKPSRVVLTVRQLRRVMAAKESLFKFGTFVPRSEREAPRWRAGRDLEWLRLWEQGTFERDWTWARIQSEHSTYRKSDIGFLFYVYDYKFSGEHRVRLVFDGSRQSAETYNETYAPTSRQESVRIFHVVCVEEAYGIGQYDVPQAFLKAFIDFVIFVHPPRGQVEFDGQILKLRRALYGGKQSAYLVHSDE
jgi:hypothetical protein